MLLEAKGFQVVTAESAEDGFKIFQKEKPDAAILDLIMEQMDSGFILAYKIKKTALLSRAIAGHRGKSLVINLPGSPKAVKECLEIVLSVIPHALEVLDKGSAECGQASINML